MRIDFASEVTFLFERISDEEYLVHGEGDDAASLADAAAQIAKHLGQEGLKCRFETYGPDDSRVAYAHHEWQLQAKAWHLCWFGCTLHDNKKHV
ncbi:hypothetical protein [Brevifollis gellanilyticus]|uniref:Uncharacterized protein n=1 Tax=Brevifollis gellanilyticus TaxID=748831 RepID=A0A512MI99_9BACT|nr:hypothetical protein [Brevifollis gellanilyticus]GEP46462.1 hypothetical protein BGE01nite_57530 [Brevifollis gellanilyticus]